LPGDEGSAASGAALLRIPAVKQRAFFGNAADVRRLIKGISGLLNSLIAPAAALLGVWLTLRNQEKAKREEWIRTKIRTLPKTDF
jgi:hypothetical protein